MKQLKHTNAKPSHYDKASEHYDSFNEENSQKINRTISRILKQHKVKSVLDMTCGTGSQVFYLAKRGFDVTGSDFNSKMLKIAGSKAREENKKVRLLKGDMRSIKAGTFDAVITVFNSIGHLTKPGFEKAINNIGCNLKDGGLYIFDINNLNYLLKDDNITALTIDWQRKTGNTKSRDVQYSTINNEGILASYTTHFEQKGSRLKETKSAQTLQVYSAKQIREMLRRNGFKVLKQCGTDGSRFDELKTDRIVTIARKQF